MGCKSARHREVTVGLTNVWCDRGLKLSEQPTLIMLGYASLAGAVAVFLGPVYFFIWRCSKRRKPKGEDQHELHTIYDHNYR